MPPPISTAVCGPQVPGTRNPGPGINIAELNPCPLKACCNIYGNCGINEDFCDTSSARNKCISNCGQQITNNQVPPKEFIRVGYFQAYNKERPCLHMDVTQVPNTFTHLHFAFADIVAGFEVSVSNIQEQFDKFVKITDKKRILSIGGASSSTDPSRARILRDTIDATNRETVATNLANFVTEHNLDGLDLDYEFFEVQGLPSFNAADGLNLSQLLKALRAKLPNKILTIAVPASYYYLQHLPIRSISNVVDYIVYMTYDLHGQWDYGSPWASSGCPAGNCLRSHVNMTETTTALAIITKSGVKANKIVVGVTSYGRSFRMTSPSCAGPMCTFTGPASGATPGRCTTTPGILANAEIKEILANNPDADATWDGFESDSNVLIFATQWVSYMDDTNKNNRIARYKMNNFGGTVDWASLVSHLQQPEQFQLFKRPITPY
ncbi:glycoside hydrolase [Eremomyces bilateralis CBS 781.70]|uniref:chitinase n=1 Tax=Eremomyces bilateralis CBS 781.70 TaxID=1392243 RepID=A0A6G1FR35_9PEZI|nr:glycoside hydrolase [Eremomyces bilateralis CBS 781.70]KAF1808141.1 glycoside hydrolase [Eremomyces bilateralis CBS 781.70]